MPVYEYSCQTCGENFDFLHPAGSSRHRVTCPKCGGGKVERRISLFAAGRIGESAPARSLPPGLCGRCGQPGPCADSDF